MNETFIDDLQLLVYDLNAIKYKPMVSNSFEYDVHKCLQKSKTSYIHVRSHKDGSNQRLKRDEAKHRNHDMKAIAADILYLLQNFGGQYGPLAWSMISTTLVVEQAAARVRMDNTC